MHLGSPAVMINSNMQAHIVCIDCLHHSLICTAQSQNCWLSGMQMKYLQTLWCALICLLFLWISYICLDCAFAQDTAQWNKSEVMTKSNTAYTSRCMPTKLPQSCFTISSVMKNHTDNEVQMVSPIQTVDILQIANSTLQQSPKYLSTYVLLFMYHGETFRMIQVLQWSEVASGIHNKVCPVPKFLPTAWIKLQHSFCKIDLIYDNALEMLAFWFSKSPRGPTT